MKTKDDAYIAGLVAVNTTLAPCLAGLVVFFLRAHVCQPKLLDVGGFCNGILAGLVSITAGCAFVKPWEACIIGFTGGLLYQASSMTLQKLKIDDVVDAFSVHGACGMWGVFALGLFGNPDEGMGGNGLFYGGDQLRTQVMGILVIVVWTAALSFLIFAPLRKIGWLRLGNAFQDEGADILEHSPISPMVSEKRASVALADSQENTKKEEENIRDSKSTAATATEVASEPEQIDV
jgi:Amt family ammonium transporter